MAALAVGASVTVADLNTDTGAAVDGWPVRTLVNPGVVAALSDWAPTDTVNDPESPSPHVKVTLNDGFGAPHDAWFCAPRVAAV